MSFLLAILPPNRDLSLVFHCLREFDIEFHVKPTFEELAPFAEKCTTGQERNAEVKEEVEESLPNVAGDVGCFDADNDNDVEIKEELITDFPFVLRGQQIPIECHDLVSEDGGNGRVEEDEVEDSGSPPNPDSEPNKKPRHNRRGVEEEKEDEGMDETADQNDSGNDEK